MRLRVAGVIVLLYVYAQPVSRIVRLSVDDVIRDGDTVLLRLGEPASPVPAPGRVGGFDEAPVAHGLPEAVGVAGRLDQVQFLLVLLLFGVRSAAEVPSRKSGGRRFGGPPR